MEKRFSKIVGMPVLFEDDDQPVTAVRDLVIDPERGKLIGLSVNHNKVISPMDITGWDEAVRIDNWDAIVDEEDIIRIDEVLKRDVKIFGNRVESESGEYIGDVTDFTVDLATNELRKLYTSKGLLGLFRYDSRIISAKNILDVTKNRIILKGNHKVREKQHEFKPSAV